MKFTNHKLSCLSVFILTALCGSNSYADSKINAQPESYVYSINMLSQPNSGGAETTPNSSVVLDFSQSAGESWDIRGESNNVVENCIQGDVITGLEWFNVKIQTEFDSFLSEATVKFSDSTSTGGVELSVGFNAEVSGLQSFTSSEIFDLTDNAVQDVESLTDKTFVVEFFEIVDDAANEIDAKYLSGTITVWGLNLTPISTCPFVSNNSSGSFLNINLESEDTPKRLREEFDVNLSVNNSGIEAATNVQAVLAFTRQLEFNNSSCSDLTESDVSEDGVIFNFNDIAVGATVDCDITFTVANYGAIELDATVTSDNNSSGGSMSPLLRLGGAALIIPTLGFVPLFLLFFMVLFIGRRQFYRY